MKIRKSVLTEALKVLGKVVSQTSPVEVQRSVRFLGVGEQVWLTATDGVESIVLEEAGDAEGMGDFAVEYKTLREMIRTARGNEVEVNGERIDWPVAEVVPEEAVSVELPENFVALLAEATPVVDRQEARQVLQGIHLCPEGIVVTDGKQLLHLPMDWTLKTPVTLPFPLALLTAKPEGAGTLMFWKSRDIQLFRVRIGNFSWFGKTLAGTYPAWRNVLPEQSALNYAITLTPEQAEELTGFLKTVPDSPPFHAIELNAVPEGVAVIPANYPDMELKLAAEVSGIRPREVLALNKHILLRMLQQGYTKFNANADGGVPIIAEGGSGRYLAMPIRMRPQTITQPKPEEKKMETVKRIELKPEPATEPVGPMEELNTAVDDLRGKLKLLLDETGTLTRKIKEAVLQQKQKEREFVQARRAIERIKMAI